MTVNIFKKDRVNNSKYKSVKKSVNKTVDILTKLNS